MTDSPNPRLQRLAELGQAPWLDSISRAWLDSGELERLVDRLALRGVTSNPSIFQAALGAGDSYDEDVRRHSGAGHDDRSVFSLLATDDIRRACDAFADVHEQTGDGYVSIEVDPDLAHDTDATVTQALELWRTVHRPNLMVKIPATEAGLPAIEQVIADGVNVNVTLLFDVGVYTRVREAWLRGLERLHETGGDVATVASVASFFVSRVDTKVDALLDEMDGEECRALRGTAAVANAVVAWADAQRLVEEPRWAPLAAAGAQPQRLLWASTGTKDPAYAPTKYVDELVAAGTVNTMPLATLEAFAAATGEVAVTIDADRVARARRELDRLEGCGIDMSRVTDELRDEGVAAFVNSFDTLLAGLASKRAAVNA
ncbi:MAG: transaldolase [Thermoleophilia bacterium]|nr:transaldolase [Thermoleophilia bacterium]